jgi:hypothetical protein
MAINPMKLVHLKKHYAAFKEDHPKFVLFTKMVLKNAMEEGTIITVSVKKPDGTKYESNFKLGENDIEMLKALLGDHDKEKE